MVKIFGKPRKDTRKSKTGEAPAGADATEGNKAPAAKAPAAGAAPAAPPPGPPARKTAAASTTTTTTRAPAKSAGTTRTSTATGTATGRTRRAPAARPPRRDWAAEAAAMPIDAPSPTPSSLAVAPSLDGVDGADGAAKRRRGTRGGRGRKKATDTAAAPADASVQVAAVAADPSNLGAIVAQQAAVLEQFTRETTAALKSMQAALAEVQGRPVREGAPGSPDAGRTAAQRVGIFVDVPNLIYAAERRKVDLDFGKVLTFFTGGRQLVRATAYAPITDDPQAKLESQRFAHHFIGHPYRIVTKPLKRFADGSMKANFDIELAVDILTMSERLDVVVLMSGDGDFVRVVELVESRGVRVEVAAFAEAAANELKTVADVFVDFGQHLDAFRK